MLKHFLLLFLSLRAADLLNLAGGLYLVPKFVSPEELGAVLPLTSFATLISIPLYAIAMTALRESATLRAASPLRAADGGGMASPSQLQAFIRGVFAAVGFASLAALALAAALLPRALAHFRVSDSLAGFLALSAAFLGCVSPVYLDQLQAAKRFGAVGAVEIGAAALRLTVMAALMPFRALAGYFAGSVAKPLVQIFAPLVLLRGTCAAVPSAAQPAPYWTRANFLRLGKTFALTLAYLALPLLVSYRENELIRTLLPSADSAGYYMVTRISDLMNYLTYPLLFVMFPYVTDHASKGESYQRLVSKSCAVIFAIAVLASLLSRHHPGFVHADLGADAIALLPNGGNYLAYSSHLPLLFLFMAFGAAQTIITNAEVAAGRFTFLYWFAPLNLAYLAILPRLLKTPTLGSLISIFFAFAAIRFLAAALTDGFRGIVRWRGASSAAA